MKTTPKLTKFDKQVIKEAYDRCYGLKQVVQVQASGWADTLAHQTGYRASYLQEHGEEVREL